MIGTKSGTEPKHHSDGYRIFIEPHWPAAMPKGKSAGVDWMKELYPSPDLRAWMKRNPRKVDAFRDRYLLELAHKEAAVDKVCRVHRERGTVTIVTPPAEDVWNLYDALVRYLRATCD